MKTEVNAEQELRRNRIYGLRRNKFKSSKNLSNGRLRCNTTLELRRSNDYESNPRSKNWATT
jgi:hypothetical protein